MEKVGDIIWDITKYLCGRAKHEADFICDLEENLQSLEAKWNVLEAMKKDAEAKIKADEETGEMQRTNEVNLWLKRIQNTEEEIKEIRVQGAQEIQNKCLSKCCPKNCKSSHKLGKKVAKMIREVDDLNTQGQRLGKYYQITHKLPHKPIGQIPLDETVGQDFIFDKVWNSIEANEVGVIGLYGTGGVGKTTLLKKINNKLVKRRPDFLVIWVVVSKEPDLDRIMDNIRKSVGIGDGDWGSCYNQEQKSSMILDALKKKKFVLLLDDVWERLNLSSVGVPYPKDTEFEYKVLFTTRLKDVCAKMKAQKSFEVEFLKEEEALELFLEKVGEETINSHPRIKVLAKEMATECKGLPLALIVVGSAMAGVQSIDAWEGSKTRLTSSPWTTSDLETKVFSILKLSYDRLPNDTHKKCFLYCALYPEDYVIRANDIIDKWIGEGLLCKDMTTSVHDLRNDGHSIITKLKLCCLLESVEDDIVVSRSFKIHDMIRDMALWLACEQDKRIKKFLAQGEAITLFHDDVETWKIVERISIITAGRETWLEPPITCPNLVALLFRGNRIGLKNIKYMSKLKVLELNAPNVHGLEEIGGLVLLEYLSLSSLEFQYPQELKNLKNLKVLNLSLIVNDNGIIPLEVISSLQQLRVLRVHCGAALVGGKDSKVEEEFLKEVECLPKIEELNVEMTTKNGVNNLFDSNKLQSCMCALRLLRLRDTIIEMHLLLASISKMKHLRQFAMGGLRRVVEDSYIYDTTYSLTTLQSVSISSCHSLTHVTWLKYAPSLQLLVIAYCNSMEQVIKEDENVDSSSIFSSLVSLTLYEVPKLENIHKTALSFPSLKSIRIYGCSNLKKLPLHSNSAEHKLALINGKKDWWNNLEWDDPTAKNHFQSKFQPREMLNTGE
ncbi:hypothetical protein QN277_010975 [Acacia crassicarpa]|uniref:AAA+ ATPase domain-containing protein n=1 Tax=Acacia crassicarpa TaxID=499986 RepID=A0AAE1IM97_9FABA|nr:hypothetical protein QN277_010975 [Acacia crassicarpa]